MASMVQVQQDKQVKVLVEQDTVKLILKKLNVVCKAAGYGDQGYRTD